MEFAFEVLIQGTMAENAQLEIRNIPVVCYCQKCDRNFQLEEYIYECPQCQQICTNNKIDLAEAVEFEQNKAIANIQKIAPQAQLFEISAKTGQGISSLLIYLFNLSKINCGKEISTTLAISGNDFLLIVEMIPSHHYARTFLLKVLWRLI